MEMPVTLPVIEFVKGTYSYRLGTEIATWMEKKRNLLVFDHQMTDASKDRQILNISRFSSS